MGVIKMGILDWINFQRTRMSILREGDKQAQKFRSTCDLVAREFVIRNGLNTIPGPVWNACLEAGTCPGGLTKAVRDLICAHAVTGVKEYAPAMAACAIYKSGNTYRDAVGISLSKLSAPSLESNSDVMIGAGIVLVFLIYLQNSPGNARLLRTNLQKLTSQYLPDDHDYIWMNLADIAKELNLV